jgi:Subtilisin inhibitor-like
VVDARQAGDHGHGRRDGAAHRRTGLVLLAALVALLSYGCGAESDEGSGDAGGGDTGAGEAPAPTGTELTVTVWLQGRDGASEEVTLTCDPPGGTHPRPEAACLALQKDPSALDPLPPDSVCTQIYGGPEEAEVVGTLDGQQVHATFSRQNGCEIDRWMRVAGILQPGD